MRQLSGTIKESLDIDFLSTGDNNLEPRSVCGRVCQCLQDACTTLNAATFIKSVNDKYESLYWEARKFADEVKEEGGSH